MLGKALIYSDLHNHRHKGRVERLHDCLAVQDWIFRTAEENDCDYIFFLGDLFHDRDQIDVLTYLRVFECFMKHMIEDAADRDVYLLVGNHDTYFRIRWDVNSVKPLTAIPRVHLIDKPSTLTLGNRRIDWMPHTDNPVKALKEFKDNYGTGDVLFGHLAVHGAALNLTYGTRADVIVEYDNDMVPVDVGVFSDWPMVVLGHYHAAQRLSNSVEYIGSPLELNFGEAFQKKHVMILDLDTMQKEYVVNKFSPKHLIITPKDIADEVYDLNHSFVRLTANKIKNKELCDLKRHIAQNFKLLSLDVKPADKKETEDQTMVQDAKAILLDTKKMLERWVQEKGVPEGMTLDRLLKAGERCLEKII